MTYPIRTHFKKLLPCWFKRFLRFIRRYFFIGFDLLAGWLFFGLSLFFQRHKKVNPDIKKILLIRLDRIGDMVCSTATLRAFRQSFFNSQIYLLLSEYTKDIVINNPCIDHILVDKKDKLEKDFDLAVALHPGLRPNFLTYLSGARMRVGFSGWGGDFFLTRKVVDDRIIHPRHEVLFCLEVAKAAGANVTDLSLEVSLTKEGEGFAEEFLRQNDIDHNTPLVVIHPGADQPYKRWRRDGFAQVADRLIEEKKAKVVVIGHKEEETLLKEIALLMHNIPILVYGVRLTKVISLIQRAWVFLGNSSGPMHIAAALSIPVVAIFGNTHPLDSVTSWRPWGEGHIVVQKDLGCYNCHPSDCRDYRCLNDITVDEVYAAVCQQLSKRKTNV